MTQPLGYYGLNLDAEVEAEFNSLSDKFLKRLLCDVADSICYRNECQSPIVSAKANDFLDELLNPQRIALIRGLCDRIEAKLLEAAK